MSKIAVKSRLTFHKKLIHFLSIFTLFFFLSQGVIAQDDNGDANGEEADAQEESSSNGGGNGIPTDDQALATGERLYKNNCTVCHAINSQVIGPALKNVHQRRDLDWLKRFIANSSRVIQSGDEYAVKLYEEYNRTQMPSFDFSDDELLAVIGYIKAESEKASDDTASSGGDGSSGGGEGASGASIPEGYLTAILAGLIVVLGLILVVLLLITTVLTKYVRQQELSEENREIVDASFDFNKLFKNPSFIGLVAFVFLAIVLKVGIDGLFSIGVQQGYAPKQPIAFSHKLHAGQYEIDCQYCHTGVRISKSANIPSANICMNCHGEIATESPEIKKIYKAVEENRPIEWVRIHNLPDLSYFNHAQHVAVGGIECQTCHGPIEEMEVVYQHSNLTMGWCINCHRETEINDKNPYYEKLVELHEGSKSPLKVKDIGGLECSKCHY